MVGGPPNCTVRSWRHNGELRRRRGMLRLLQQQRDIRRGPLSDREPFASLFTGGHQHLPGTATTDNDPHCIRRANPHSDRMLTDGDQYRSVGQRGLDKLQCSGSPGQGQADHLHRYHQRHQHPLDLQQQPAGGCTSASTADEQSWRTIHRSERRLFLYQRHFQWNHLPVDYRGCRCKLRLLPPMCSRDPDASRRHGADFERGRTK